MVNVYDSLSSMGLADVQPTPFVHDERKIGIT